VTELRTWDELPPVFRDRPWQFTRVSTRDNRKLRFALVPWADFPGVLVPALPEDAGSTRMAITADRIDYQNRRPGDGARNGLAEVAIQANEPVDDFVLLSAEQQELAKDGLFPVGPPAEIAAAGCLAGLEGGTDLIVIATTHMEPLGISLFRVKARCFQDSAPGAAERLSWPLPAGLENVLPGSQLRALDGSILGVVTLAPPTGSKVMTTTARLRAVIETCRSLHPADGPAVGGTAAAKAPTQKFFENGAAGTTKADVSEVFRLGSSLLLVDAGRNELLLLDRTDLRITKREPAGGTIADVKLWPDDPSVGLLLLSDPPSIATVDLTTLKPLRRREVRPNPAFCHGLPHDGFIYSTAAGTFVDSFRPGFKEIAVTREENANFVAAANAPVLYLASIDQMGVFLHQADLRSGIPCVVRSVRAGESHYEEARTMLLSRDGRYLATGRLIWDTTDLTRPLYTAPKEGGSILAFITADAVVATCGGLRNFTTGKTVLPEVEFGPMFRFQDEKALRRSNLGFRFDPEERKLYAWNHFTKALDRYSVNYHE
jgi:hypothetical protein